MPEKEKTDGLTLKQVYPLCDVAEDEQVALRVDTERHSTHIRIRKCEIPTIISDTVLNSRVSLVHFNIDLSMLEITVKVDKKQEDKADAGTED